ncbi:MAG: ABC transporter ATP-binding protein [Chloroflexales bacterium]|nr:ABC transporter ATP-binding protein [Chloroflexales bacterium]
MSIIIAEGLTKQFSGEPRPAVDGVSFAVEAGEFIVLLGPSGCGKTTLLKMLNRLYEPTAGRLLIDGADARGIPATELRRRIGYAIQQTGLFPHLRVEQNIAVVPRLIGWPRPRIEARVDELLDLVGLPRAYRARYPSQLSGGEQQRVGLARALAADPALMLMDEPFGALDAITRARLQDELLGIQRKLHKTILFVTHDVEEALRLADRIVVMREGRIVQFDTPLAILTRPSDPFVEQLVGAEDALRQLSLMSVGGALARRASLVEGGNGAASLPALRPGDDLRTALAQLLSSGGEALPVVEGGREIGRITLADLRAMLNGPDVAEPAALEHER